MLREERDTNNVIGSSLPHVRGDRMMIDELRALGYKKFCDLYESMSHEFGYEESDH